MNKYILLFAFAFLFLNLNAQDDTIIKQSTEKNSAVENKMAPINSDYRLQTKNASFGDRELLIKDISAMNFKGSRNGVVEYLTDNNQPIRSIEKTKDIIGVVQNEAGQVLIGATIAAYDKGRLTVGTATSLNGVFELTTNGSELEIRYLGYQSIRKNIQYFLDNPVITLNKDPLNLPKVIVTAMQDYSSGCCCNHCYHIKTNAPISEINLDISFTSTKWQVYPNPTINKITVKTVFSDGIFKLLSTNGQILETIPIYHLQTDINLDKYPAGSYYLRYESESWVETFGPIVKVNY